MTTVSHVRYPFHHLTVFSSLTLSDINPHATDEIVPLYRQFLNKLSITKPQEPPTVRHREDQVSNPQATPPHQTSSGTAKDTNTVLHQQITHLQQDNTRLKQEVTSLKQEKVHLKQHNASQTQIHQQEVTLLKQENNSLKQDCIHHHQTISQLHQDISRHQQDNAHLKLNHQQEITRLQEEATQLQSRLDQQPKLGSDTDISFWVVSHNEVRPTGQVLGEGGWGRVVLGSFRGQDV